MIVDTGLALLLDHARKPASEPKHRGPIFQPTHCACRTCIFGGVHFPELVTE